MKTIYKLIFAVSSVILSLGIVACSSNDELVDKAIGGNRFSEFVELPQMEASVADSIANGIFNASYQFDTIVCYEDYFDGRGPILYDITFENGAGVPSKFIEFRGEQIYFSTSLAMPYIITIREAIKLQTEPLITEDIENVVHGGTISYNNENGLCSSDPLGVPESDVYIFACQDSLIVRRMNIRKKGETNREYLRITDRYYNRIPMRNDDSLYFHDTSNEHQWDYFKSKIEQIAPDLLN